MFLSSVVKATIGSSHRRIGRFVETLRCEALDYLHHLPDKAWRCMVRNDTLYRFSWHLMTELCALWFREVWSVNGSGKFELFHLWDFMTCDLYVCDYDIRNILSLWLKRTTHKAFFDFTETALGRSFTETSNQRTSCWSLDIDLNFGIVGCRCSGRSTHPPVWSSFDCKQM